MQNNGFLAVSELDVPLPDGLQSPVSLKTDSQIAVTI